MTVCLHSTLSAVGSVGLAWPNGGGAFGAVSEAGTVTYFDACTPMPTADANGT